MENLVKGIRHFGKKMLLKLGFHRLPDFLIIGAQKAGTTFLYSVLRQHPQIIEPVNKEAHFFDYDTNFNRGLFRYHLNFDLSFRYSPNQFTFEATPDYLAHKLAPKRIHQFLPNVKLIVVLREPISRAYSAWKMHHYTFKEHKRHQWLHDPRSFEQVITDSLDKEADEWHIMNHIGRGLYGLQLTNLFKYFSDNQVLIIFQKELREDTQKTINCITDFLKLNSFDLNMINLRDERYWENKSDNTEMLINEYQQNLLTDYYKNDRAKLESILKKEVNW